MLAEQPPDSLSIPGSSSTTMTCLLFTPGPLDRFREVDRKQLCRAGRLTIIILPAQSIFSVVGERAPILSARDTSSANDRTCIFSMTP
jgi:hypothetical protein